MAKSKPVKKAPAKKTAKKAPAKKTAKADKTPAATSGILTGPAGLTQR